MSSSIILIVLTSTHFSFSLTVQTLSCISMNTLSSWKSCDERFFWNLNVLSNLIDTPNIDSRWITPVTNMWVSSEEITVKMKNDKGEIKDEKFTLSLVSRRNRRRQGPRYPLSSSFSFNSCYSHHYDEYCVLWS